MAKTTRELGLFVPPEKERQLRELDELEVEQKSRVRRRMMFRWMGWGAVMVLLVLIRVIYRPDGMRDYMFALFTGFVVAYVVLTIVGSFFRGQQMILMWPWDPRQARIE